MKNRVNIMLFLRRKRPQEPCSLSTNSLVTFVPKQSSEMSGDNGGESEQSLTSSAKKDNNNPLIGAYIYLSIHTKHRKGSVFYMHHLMCSMALYQLLDSLQE